MARPPGLRVVDPAAAPDEPTKTRKKTTHPVAAACDTGTRRDVLVALRTRLARSIDDPATPARDLASLSRRLLEVTKDLESLDAAAEQEDGTAAPTPDEHWTAI
jgi:hypothetical protein